MAIPKLITCAGVGGAMSESVQRCTDTTKALTNHASEARVRDESRFDVKQSRWNSVRISPLRGVYQEHRWSV